MRISTREDFRRWLDEQLLRPAEGLKAELAQEASHVAASPLSRAAISARERAKARRFALPGGLASVMAGGYTGGFRKALSLPASFQLVRVEGLETIEKGACTVRFEQAISSEFQGREALKVAVTTTSEGGRMGRLGAFSERCEHYYDPVGLRLLGWEQGSRRLALQAGNSEPESWQLGRTYALGASTLSHHDGRLLESFVHRAQITELTPTLRKSGLASRLQPTFEPIRANRDFSLALRSFSVDDDAEQSAVLELYEFEMGPKGLQTKSHNICAVQESLEWGNLLQMTMIRCK